MDALDRTLQPTRRVLGDVDPVQPLDTTHPLLDSVQGFWLPLPRLTGGSRLYDLSKRSHHLSFTFPPTWVQSTDSQYPALSFNATDIVEGPFEPLRSSGSQTLVCTIIRTGSNNADFGNALLHWLGSDRYTLGLDKNEVPFVLTSGGNTLSLNSSTPIPLDTFTTISTSWDQPANDLAVYVNGEPDHKTSNYGDTSSASSPDFVVGKGGGADSLPMVLVGAAAYSTYWPEALHKSWHSQARRGFPDVLRRRDSVGLLGGGGGPTADTVSFDMATALADGFAPTITATANPVSLGTAQATAQGFSATITATQNTVAVGTAQATAQGFAPTISADPNTIAATTGQATAEGFDPTISEGAAGDTISADLGTAQAQAFDPSITTTPATVTFGLGQATANGFDPDVVADPSEINTGQGQAAATGFDPTITKSARTVAPQVGQAQSQGFEPAVVDGNVGVATTMEIEARPLYEIDVEVRPLYRIRLFVKEQLP